MSVARASHCIAIGAALDWELRAVLSALGDARRERHGALGVWRSAGGPHTIFVYRTGVGVDDARRRTRALLDAGGVGALINTGCAGGLRDDLRAGALLVAEAMIGPLPGRNRHLADSALAERLRAAARASGSPCYDGDLLTSPVPLLTAASKREQQAFCAALAVDMESAAVGGVAATYGVPVAGLRAILDTADLDLPPIPAPSALPAAASPSDALAMARLKLSQRSASESLRHAFSHFATHLRKSPLLV